MTSPQRITVLGSTGSVGRNTLAVIEESSNFTVHALSANSNVDLMAQQCQRFQPEIAVMADAHSASKLAVRLATEGIPTRVLEAADALEQIASAADTDVVMAAIVGAAGLDPTLAAVNSGKRVLLANKESLVMSGALFMEAARRSGAVIVPIDSEHNAVFQCLPQDFDATLPQQVEKIVLTASGGPFLHTPADQFGALTPDQACAHPKWKMGRKISVDSATMMNKGLEIIEASYLFGLNADQIEVLVHPQSIIHSMVYYRDGSVLAQLANPDMRVPIAHGLAYPERMPSGAATLDLSQQPALEFLQPDLDKFPCLRLGFEAVTTGGTMPAVLNAANEEAVAAFLREDIRFDQIPSIIAKVLAKIPCEAATSLAIIQSTDREARSLCKELIIKDFI